MYKNYIFDLYGTLVDIKTNENSKLLWDKLSLFYSFNGAYYDSKSLKAAYKKKLKNTKLSIRNTVYPDFPLEDIFRGLFQDKIGTVSDTLVKSTAQIFRTLSIKYLRLYDGVISLLELLKKNNKNIYLLSNAQEIFTSYELKILGIEKYFDSIYFSSTYGVCKPDKIFYQKIINNLKLDIEKSIMIGNDSIADIQGAKSVGLDTLYIHSNLSPNIENQIYSTFSIMDGNIKDIARLIIWFID